MKRLLPLLAMVLMISIAASAMAAPLMLGHGYTAYIGENSYLFLEDPNGSAKVLRATISSLLSMDETTLYCLTAEGRMYGIKLDGSGTEIVAANPTAADLEKYAQKLPYQLVDQKLSVIPASGDPLAVADHVTAATANATNLFYMRKADGKTSLYSASLTPTGGNIVPARIGDGVESPLSMLATKDTLTVLHQDRTVTMVNLADQSIVTAAPTSTETAAALFHNGNLIRYTADAQNNLTVESITANRSAASATDSARGTADSTAATTGTASANAAAPTATPRPTAAPSQTTRVTTRSTTRPNRNSNTSSNLKKGSTGARVRKMQNRLAELGYPVGNVDGKLGDMTLHAIHLFQTTVGERERNEITEKLLKKLHAKNAPAYDAFRPVSPGDNNAFVKQMQARLIQLGYLSGDADGKFGPKTQTAVIGFQTAIGLPLQLITGFGDRDTLIRLYDLNAPTFTPGAVPPPPQVNPYPNPPVPPPLPPFQASPSNLSP